MSRLEMKFDEDMKELYFITKKECRYNATRFLQIVAEKGGVAAAKQLIARPGGTEGFEKLWECGRLYLSIEAYVLKPEYDSLFTEEEKRRCRELLMSMGYKVD